MKEIKHGFLGKWKTYKKVGFEEVPPSTEERQQELLNKMKPWEYDPKRIKVKYGFVGGEAPTPPTPSVEVSIAPSSAVQYENVILSASTTGTSPTYIWTLTDFYDVSDNPITSYTGSVLTEGYFTSTGSSNVSVVVSADEGSGSTSTFSVSAFVPTTISDLIAWYDLSDVSTITLRTGTDYIEQIDDKSGNGYNMTQSTATNQPLYSASTTNPSLSAATFDGIDNWITGDRGAITNPTEKSVFVMGRGYNKAGSVPGVGTGNQLDGMLMIEGPSFSYSPNWFYVGKNNSGTEVYNQAYSDQDKWTYSTLVGTPLIYSYFSTDNTAAGFTRSVVNGDNTPDASSTGSGVIDARYMRFGANLHNTSNFVQKLYGEIGEAFNFDRILTNGETAQLDRYLQYKWLGSMTY